MTRTHRVWKHMDEAVDEAFAHADNAFKSADKAFAEAERIFSDLPFEGEQAKTEKTHILRFDSRTFSERMRLTKKFFSMGLALLFTGKSELRFRNRK